jgi:hypothetical protein
VGTGVRDVEVLTGCLVTFVPNDVEVDLTRAVPLPREPSNEVFDLFKPGQKLYRTQLGVA